VMWMALMTGGQADMRRSSVKTTVVAGSIAENADAVASALIARTR
jgi:hypothetical protein